MSKVRIYSRFDPPPKTGLGGFEPTLAQQQFREDSNINNIVARAIATNNTSVFNPADRGEYYDTTVYDDYQSALEVIRDIRDDFESLPSRVRREFDNRPEKYVAFMSDPRNAAKAIELGLLEGVEKSSPPGTVSGTSQPPAGGVTVDNNSQQKASDSDTGGGQHSSS